MGRIGWTVWNYSPGAAGEVEGIVRAGQES